MSEVSRICNAVTVNCDRKTNGSFNKCQ